MNRFEILVGGALFLALLQACTEPDVEPILDFDTPYEAKFGKPMPRPPATWLECDSKPGKFYKKGHEIVCLEDRNPVPKPETPEPPQEPPVEPPVVCTMLWTPGAEYATVKVPEKECA